METKKNGLLAISGGILTVLAAHEAFDENETSLGVKVFMGITAAILGTLSIASGISYLNSEE